SGSSRIEHKPEYKVEPKPEHKIEKTVQHKPAIAPEKAKVSKKAGKAATPKKDESFDARDKPPSPGSLEDLTK
ncbi:MAG TPA: hypothetical protein VF360_02635, partial [Candidatus Methanoperedens sp.]